MNHKKIIELIDIGRALAMENPSATRHISFLFSKKKLLAIGNNYNKSHTIARKRGYYNEILHSELAAFIKIPYNQRENLILVNMRFNKKGELRISNPCEKCAKWIYPICRQIWASQSSGEILQLK